MGHDGAVRGGVGHAGQHEAVALLGIVQEGLVGLVDGARDDLAGARRAGTSAARVGQVQTGLLLEEEGRWFAAGREQASGKSGPTSAASRM